MLAILDRYLIREMFASTVGVVIVLLVILLGNTSVRILGKVVEGILPKDALMPMVAINMVHYLTILLPLSLFLGILLAMGRLYRDNEITAFYACGVSNQRLYRPLLILAVATTSLSAVLALYIAPKVSVARQMIKHQVEQRSELAGINPGSFNVSKSGDGMMFVEQLGEQRQMLNVFLSINAREPETERLLESAHEAQSIVDQERHKPYMVYRDGYLYAVPKQGLGLRITEFEEHGIEVQEKSYGIPDLKISAVSTWQLWQQEDGSAKAELHWRFALPIACFLLAVLALPLSYTTPRKGRFSKFVVGILVYLIYTNLLGIGRAMIEKSQLSSAIAMNLVHFLLLVFIVSLLWKQSGFVWFGFRRTTRAAA